MAVSAFLFALIRFEIAQAFHGKPVFLTCLTVEDSLSRHRNILGSPCVDQWGEIIAIHSFNARFHHGEKVSVGCEKDFCTVFQMQVHVRKQTDGCCLIDTSRHNHSSATVMRTVVDRRIDGVRIERILTIVEVCNPVVAIFKHGVFDARQHLVHLFPSGIRRVWFHRLYRLLARFLILFTLSDICRRHRRTCHPHHSEYDDK